nr:hypothetical protein [Granulosicoccus sp.]
MNHTAVTNIEIVTGSNDVDPTLTFFLFTWLLTVVATATNIDAIFTPALSNYESLINNAKRHTLVVTASVL